MNIPILKKKHDASHYGIAMPTCGLFEDQTASTEKATRLKKEPAAHSRAKFKYALHNQLFICLNVRVNNLKKNP